VAHSPSSARMESVEGGLGLPALRTTPQPQTPRYPVTVGYLASISKNIKVS
jgi:hypothetical protein